MTSIFRRALGSDFARLHPKLRERFGFAASDGIGCVGTGVMARISRAPAIARPLLRLGATRHVLFPESGDDIAFTIENYAYLDRYGRETVSFARTFELRTHRRRFDATMVFNEERGGIVDYLGTHQHLAVDLRLGVDSSGGLRISTHAQRFYQRAWGVPVPRTLTATARVHEWYDEAAERFRIAVRVSNPCIGQVFGYHGSFTVTYVDTRRAPVPAGVRPVVENGRG